jgi:hypothetical protein
MATMRIQSVAPGNPPCKIVGGPDDGKLTITGITGKTLILAGHTTTVTMSFHCPPTDPALGSMNITYDPTTGVFDTPITFIVDNPCGATVGDLAAIIKVVYLFQSNSGGPDQTLVEDVPITVTCPLRNCTDAVLKKVAAVKKAKRKSGKKSTSKAKASRNKKLGQKKKTKKRK